MRKRRLARWGIELILPVVSFYAAGAIGSYTSKSEPVKVTSKIYSHDSDGAWERSQPELFDEVDKGVKEWANDYLPKLDRATKALQYGVIGAEFGVIPLVAHAALRRRN